MPRFKPGDRVQLVGDIARFYSCLVGVIAGDGTYPASVLNQYKVRLANGTVGMFFDFQLQSPPVIAARLIFDTLVTSKSSGTRGQTTGRHVRLAGRDIDIHLKIAGSPKRTILGQVTAGTTVMRHALVTLLIEDQPVDTVATDDAGEFTLRDVQADPVGIEIFVPSRRILVSL